MKIEREDIITIIGDKVKKARRSKGYTQDSATEAMEISKDLLRNIENGRSVGSVETIINICNTFGITPNYLFCELLDMQEEIINQELYNDFQKLNIKQKELIQTMLKHLIDMNK